MNNLGYKLADYLHSLRNDPINVLCLAAFVIGVVFVTAVWVDAWIHKRKIDRLSRPYLKGRH